MTTFTADSAAEAVPTPVSAADPTDSANTPDRPIGEVLDSAALVLRASRQALDALHQAATPDAPPSLVALADADAEAAGYAHGLARAIELTNEMRDVAATKGYDNTAATLDELADRIHQDAGR